MEKQISNGLKITFLVHLIVGVIFGLIYLLIPEVWGNLVNWPVKEPALYRLVGAAILGFSTSSWLAYRETAWEKVKIVGNCSGLEPGHVRLSGKNAGESVEG